MSTTFEHGNLIRGVCPIADFSQTLIHEVRQAAAASFYMTHHVLSVAEALQLGLAQEVCHGTSYAQQRAQQVAHARISAVLTLADPGILAQEAMGHAECRLINRGEAKSALHDATGVFSHRMISNEIHDASPMPRGSAQQVPRLLFCGGGGHFDGQQQRTLLNTMRTAHEQLLHINASQVIALGLHDACSVSYTHLRAHET